jgi:uncharacterized protein (TIGR02266 family)
MSDTTSDGKRERAHLPLKVEYPSIDAFLEDWAVNVSRGGTMIQVARPLVDGDLVELALAFPGLLTSIKLRGVVRWVQRDGEEQHAGVEFEQTEAAPWEALTALVERIRAGDRALVAPIVRVLIVEDNTHVAKLLADGLEAFRKRAPDPLAFAVRFAVNGREALTALDDSPSDLLLVDMYLPVLDGEGLIHALRADPRFQALPVVALSAGGREAMEGAITAGADFFLEKPVRLNEVLTVVRKLLPRILGARG